MLPLSANRDLCRRLSVESSGECNSKAGKTYHSLVARRSEFWRLQISVRPVPPPRRDCLSMPSRL